MGRRRGMGKGLKGRPRKIDILLDKDTQLQVEGWLRDGATINEICKTLGMSTKVWYHAMNISPEFAEMTKRTREVVDREVENALYKKALGYTYEEIVEEYEAGFLTKKKVTTKKMAPDTYAQIFWLKNRMNGKWRDKREIDNTLALNKLDEVLGQIKGCE